MTTDEVSSGDWSLSDVMNVPNSATHVIIRNRSFQHRTDQGARAHDTLTSLVATLMLQKKNALEELRKFYPLHRQQALNNPGRRTPLMFPS